MTNYDNGARLERAAKTDLETAGYLVLRSSGSHGPADLVALPRRVPAAGDRPGRILLIQCKTDAYMPRTARLEFARLSQAVGAIAILCYWRKEGRAARKPAYRVILLDGSSTTVDLSPGKDQEEAS